MSLDGNMASRNQTLGLATTLRDMAGGGTLDIIRPLAPGDAKALANNTIVTWLTPPSAKALKALPCAEGQIAEPWPDLVVSCRPEVAALALGIKQASGGRTKIVQIQNPHEKTGTYRFDLRQFDLILKQAHEDVAGPNVISSALPLHDLAPEKLAEYRADALRSFPHYRHEPATIVLLGGSDENVRLDAADFAHFGRDVAAFSERAWDVHVLTSRRTGEDQKQAFRDAVRHRPNVFIDHPDMTYRRALGIGSAFIVDGGSASMLAECLYPGEPVTVYGYRGKLKAHPIVKLGIWQQAGVMELPVFCPPNPAGPATELTAIGRQILTRLHGGRKAGLPMPRI